MEDKPIFIAPINTVSAAGAIADNVLGNIYSVAFNKLGNEADISGNIGIVGDEFVTRIGTQAFNKITLGNINTAISETVMYYAYEKNQYTDAQGNGRSYSTVILDSALINVTFNNQVIKTQIQGLPYTIKEYISGSDLDISITGKFSTNDPYLSVSDFYTALAILLNAATSIPVTNTYLNKLGVYNIVIMPSCSLPQNIGEYTQQTYTINAVSDVPVTTILP